MSDTTKRPGQPQGGQGVLGDKQAFKQGETHDAATDRQAKDEVGRMGEKTRGPNRPMDVD